MRWLALRLAAAGLALALLLGSVPPSVLLAQTPTPAVTPTATPTTPATSTPTPTATLAPTATASPTLVGTLAPTPTPGTPTATTLFIPFVLKRAVHGDSGATVESGIQVQNLGSAPADLTLVYYDSNGSTAPQWTEHASVAAGDAYTFYTPANPFLPDGFVGAAVLQATQPVGALVNLQALEAPRYFFDTFVAQRTPAQTVYLPYVVKQVGTRTSTVAVQNAGAAPATATLNFVTSDGQIYRLAVPLPPYTARQVRLAERAELPVGLDAALVVQADQPLVVAGSLYDTATGIYQLSSGLTTAAAQQAVPLVFKQRNGWDSEVRVQNTANAPVSVRVRVQPTGGGLEIATPPVTVPANAPYTFRPTDLPALPGDFVGSATVEATGGGVVAMSTETNLSRGTGMAYNAFNPAAATTRISVPLIFKHRNGFDTGIQVQNLDTTDAQVRVTYRLSTGQTVVEFGVVPANGSYTFYQPDNAQIPDGSVGSAVVENIGGTQRIVAIINQVNYERGGDASSTYEGLNY
ncbi:MAG TPA: hypothetical protein VKZ60_03870 [Chloroflexota bacterium]|jgi:hypothetical protein|nr:hypothetical protein [Chloroflexota bacterium]